MSFWSSYEHLHQSIIRKTKKILNGKSQNYYLNVNEDFVMFLTSKLITCFIDGFTSGMISQSIAYLLIGSAHVYWILHLEGEVHSIWDS